MAMVLLFVVCGWWEEAVAEVCLRTYLVHFYIRFFGYQGYKRWKNCKPSCIVFFLPTGKSALHGQMSAFFGGIAIFTIDHYWPRTDRRKSVSISWVTNDHYWLRGKRNGNGICFRFRNRNVFPFPRGNGKWKHVSVSRNGFPFPWCHLIYSAALPECQVNFGNTTQD